MRTAQTGPDLRLERSKRTHCNFVYSIRFPRRREAYCTSWVVSGYAREVKNGFVTISLNWQESRLSYEMVERNTDCEHSLIFLKDSEVTSILWAWRSRETRDSCLASLSLHALGVRQRQDTFLLMPYKRFNGYLDYLNTSINMVKICFYELMPVLFGTKCIWKKKKN